MAARVVSSALLGLGLAQLVAASDNVEQAPLHKFRNACPAYTNYAAHSQYALVIPEDIGPSVLPMSGRPPLSPGPYRLPFQRPERRCRTFHSDEIERVIEEVTSRMEHPDLARLFENAFPSTTDTTIAFHTRDGKDLAFEQMYDGEFDPREDGAWLGPQSFIITGDIIAEWLRDSAHQLRPYQALAKKDPAIFDLILGAINTQAEYVIKSPYCNAFQPPPISNLPTTDNGQSDAVHPAYEPSVVFECKYELDSLASFLKLANDFHDSTGSVDHIQERWHLAVQTLLRVLREQSAPTFDPDTGRFVKNAYTFQRPTTAGTETLSLHGVGNPLNGGTGLVRSAFRPSDDATILGFFIPANAMMSVELRRTAEVLHSVGQKGIAAALKEWSETIRAGVLEHGVVTHKKYGEVFAYEVDGYGSSIMMDDANYPSLLALPIMGFCDVDDPVYQNTRRMILDRMGNPYYLTGSHFKGIGGPHIGLRNAWPMSVLIQAQTTDDDAEIKKCLDMVLRASPLGLVHESVDVNFPTSYTRSWFAWVNGVFATTILDIAARKPHLIFGEGAAPYEV